MLCFDLYTKIDDFNLITSMQGRFLECKKNLVFINSPNYLDQCNLSDTVAVQLKKYEPLSNDKTKLVYFVGSGNFDDGCFPGNIFMYIIDADMWLRAKWILTGGYFNPDDHPLTPAVKAYEERTEEEKVQALIDLNKEHKWLKKNVAPYIEYAIESLMEYLGGVSAAIESNADDGSYVISDKQFGKMDDW